MAKKSYKKTNNAQNSKDQKQVQTNINERLDRMRFNDVTGTDFDAAIGTHTNDLISFVTRDSSTVELYKGEIKVSGAGVERDVMTTHLPHGRDFLWKTPVDSTGTTTLGTTDIENLYNSTSQTLNNEIRVMPFRGGLSNSIVYKSLYLNANAPLISSNYIRSLPATRIKDNGVGYGSDDFESSFSRCSYSQIRFYIRRIVNGIVSSDKEYFIMTIFPGMFRPLTEINHSQDQSSQGSTWYNDSHLYTCLPAIDIWYQKQVNGTWSAQQNYKYIARPGSNDQQSEYNKPRAPRFAASLHIDNPWPITYTWNEIANGYNSVFATCGLIPVFFRDTINIEENLNVYDLKNNEWLYKPRIGVISKNSWYDATANKRITHDAYLTVLRESASSGLRLGLNYDLATGAALDPYTMDTDAKVNAELAACNYIIKGTR